MAFVGSHRWPWHLKAVGCTPTRPTLVFRRRRPRDRGNGSIRAHTAAVRLIASTAPDGEESGTEREREKEREIERSSRRGKTWTKSSSCWLLHQTRRAHHGRLWPDRRWAVLLLPREPHLGDVLRAGRTGPSPRERTASLFPLLWFKMAQIYI